MKVPCSLRLLVATCSFAAFPSLADNTREQLLDALYKLDFDVQDAPEKEKKPLSLDGEFGVLLSTGNTEATSLKAGITSEQELTSWSNSYFAEVLYKTSEVDSDDTPERQTTAQRFFGSAQFDYKLNANDRRLFFYGDYENDRFNGYDYRASLASGWSQKFELEGDSDFRYSIGPGYSLVEAEEDNNAATSGFIVRASAEYRYHWDSGAKIRQFLSTEAGNQNTKSRSETALSAKIMGKLAMKLSFILNHESSPTEDAETLSTETSLALVYQFF